MPETLKRLTVEITRQAMKAYVNAGEFKTLEAFNRQLWRAALDFYRGDIDAFQFIDDFTASIQEQLTRAWNEGARSVNVDPRDFSDEDLQRLQDIIDSEYNHIEGLGGDIENAKLSGLTLDQFRTQFRARIDLWSNRYNETVNAAVQYFSAMGQKLEWVLGDTIEHCQTNDPKNPGHVGCEDLNGIVLFASEWEQAGINPQSPPNNMITCGGWKCQCSKTPTDKRHTPNGLRRVLDLMTAANL